MQNILKYHRQYIAPQFENSLGVHIQIENLLDNIQVAGVDISVHSVKDYRFVLVLKGDGLDPNIT